VTLIVYGANCAWWDSIDKTSRIPGTSLPCCPHCHSVLFQMEEEDWNAGIAIVDRKTPGYAAMIEWSRGKCFRSFKELQAAYQERSKSEP
jgi:hypothetical protein